jgi:hypothetical protein
MNGEAMRYLNILTIACLITAGTGYARPARTLLVEDDQLPFDQETEFGLELAINELEDGGDGRAVVPYVRYGVSDNMAASLRIPYIANSSDALGSVSGLGDIGLGLSILAYGPADIGDYSIVCNMGVKLPTGNEDKGLGIGETTYSAGVVFAMRLTSELTGILDGRYISGAADSDMAVAGFALIEQVTSDFSVNLELFNRMIDPGGLDEWRTTVTIGMSIGNIADIDDLSMMWTAGADITDESSMVVGARFAYQY